MAAHPCPPAVPVRGPPHSNVYRRGPAVAIFRYIHPSSPVIEIVRVRPQFRRQIVIAQPAREDPVVPFLIPDFPVVGRTYRRQFRVRARPDGESIVCHYPCSSRLIFHVYGTFVHGDIRVLIGDVYSEDRTFIAAYRCRRGVYLDHPDPRGVVVHVGMSLGDIKLGRVPFESEYLEG